MMHYSDYDERGSAPRYSAASTSRSISRSMQAAVVGRSEHDPLAWRGER